MLLRESSQSLWPPPERDWGLENGRGARRRNAQATVVLAVALASLISMRRGVETDDRNGEEYYRALAAIGERRIGSGQQERWQSESSSDALHRHCHRRPPCFNHHTASRIARPYGHRNLGFRSTRCGRMYRGGVAVAGGGDTGGVPDPHRIVGDFHRTSKRDQPSQQRHHLLHQKQKRNRHRLRVRGGASSVQTLGGDCEGGVDSSPPAVTGSYRNSSSPSTHKDACTRDAGSEKREVGQRVRKTKSNGARDGVGGRAALSSPPVSIEEVLARPDPEKLSSHDLAGIFGFPRDFYERYNVKRRIGEGAYGIVACAEAKQENAARKQQPPQQPSKTAAVGERHPEAPAEVAVKIINKRVQKKNNKTATVRFIRRITEEIKHFALMGGDVCSVALQGYYEDARYLYIVMELCRGGELARRMRRASRERLEEDEVAIIAYQMLWQLGQWHSRGFVHTDINPLNFIFVNRDPTDLWIKALDFGLSQSLPGGGSVLNETVNNSNSSCEHRSNGSSSSSSSSSSSNSDRDLSALAAHIPHPFVPNNTVFSESLGRYMLVRRRGTPVYTAPEVTAKCYDEKADLWSVGALLFHMLLGRVPIVESSMREIYGLDKTEIYDRIRDGKLMLEGADWESLSPEARDFLARIIVKDPRKRLSASEALRHPWLTQASVTSYLSSHRVLSKLVPTKKDSSP